MLADVAEAGGAEQGVGDRMENDVGIAVAGEARARAGLATPPSMIGPSPAKAWTSKPMPVRGDRRPASHCSARSKSAGSGELVEGGIAVDGGDLHAGGAKHRGLVGREAPPDQLAYGPAERSEPERLRRLDADEAGSVDELVEAFVRRERACRRPASTGAAPSWNSS